MQGKLYPRRLFIFFSGMSLGHERIEVLQHWSRQLTLAVLSQNAVNILRAIDAEIPAEVAAHYKVGSEWGTLHQARVSLDATDAFIREEYVKIKSFVFAAIGEYADRSSTLKR